MSGAPLRLPRGRQPSASAATSYDTTTSRLGSPLSAEPPLRSSCQHSVIGSPALSQHSRLRLRHNINTFTMHLDWNHRTVRKQLDV